MKVLLTGHKGYIGALAGPMLRSAGHDVIGVDTDLFAGCDLGSPDGEEIQGLRKDIRNLAIEDLRDHLILEYEIPKYDGDLGQPSVFIPLEMELSRKKVRLIMDTFQSQRDKHWFEATTFFSLMRLRGIECRAAGGHAEAFYCRKLVL